MSIEYVQVGNDVAINYIIRGGDYNSITSTDTFYANYHTGILTINGLKDVVQGSKPQFLIIRILTQTTFFEYLACVL